MSAAGLPRRDTRRAPALLALAAIVALVVASFLSLDLRWDELLSADAPGRLGRFATEFFPPATEADFVRRVAWASLETLAMSALGTVRRGSNISLRAPARSDGSWSLGIANI